MTPFKAIYTLFCAKLLTWQIGILLGARVNSDSINTIEANPLIPIASLVVGILGLLNLKWNSFVVYSVVSLTLALLWLHMLLSYEYSNISFFRVIPETIACYVLLARIQIKGKNF